MSAPCFLGRRSGSRRGSGGAAAARRHTHHAGGARPTNSGGLPAAQANPQCVAPRRPCRANRRRPCVAQLEPRLFERTVSKADLATIEQDRCIGRNHRDPRQVAAILRESTASKRGRGILICETRYGMACANAGVDLSNALCSGHAVLLPRAPDARARRLRQALMARGAGPLGVVVSDTFGRSWREGLVDVVLSCAGLAPTEDLRGQTSSGAPSRSPRPPPRTSWPAQRDC